MSSKAWVEYLLCMCVHVFCAFVTCAFQCVWLIPLHHCWCSCFCVLSLLLPLSFLFLWVCLVGVLGTGSAAALWLTRRNDESQESRHKRVYHGANHRSNKNNSNSNIFICRGFRHTAQRLPVRPLENDRVQIEQESRNGWEIQRTWEGKPSKWI